MLRTTPIAVLALLALASATAQASTRNIAGQPATPGAQPIGSAPVQPNPIAPKSRPVESQKTDIPWRTDTVVLGDNVGPGIVQGPTLEPKYVHQRPIIHAPPNWRGTEAEWEDHVRFCDAQIGGTDWWTGRYIAAADLLAHCPYDRGAEGPPIITARSPRTREHVR